VVPLYVANKKLSNETVKSINIAHSRRKQAESHEVGTMFA